MQAVTIIFPHQLFQKHPALRQGRKVIIIEEELFFNQFQFHKKKLMLHRASMQYYKTVLEQQGYQVQYIEAASHKAAVVNAVAALPKGVQQIHVADVTDDWLSKRLIKAAGKRSIEIVWYRTPNFINSPHELDAYFATHPNYFQTHFYKAQRQQRKLLLEPNGQPLGGKWTYDEENRKRLPKDHKPPVVTLPNNRNYVPDAIHYIEKKFSANYGTTDPPFEKRQGFYPVTHAEADAWLTKFLQERFALFGAFEDAMQPAQPVLYHSCISLLLNIGLLQPQQVLDKVLDAAIEYNIPLNSLEGFVRQLVGWREFVRAVYEREGRMQRTKNFFGFSRKIPESFWQGTTGIEPVDVVVKKALSNGYNHHIERLMVMGNFMLLCEFHPDEVYRWFMEMYVDAYDWVMVPNTYGMISFADGGLMMTKPYISSSNYLLKMGPWKKGPWTEVWDALFWRFMHVQRHVLGANPRLGMLLRNFDKQPAVKRDALLKRAEVFLNSLDAD